PPAGIADLARNRSAARQEQSGTHQLLERLLADAGVAANTVKATATARTESDATVAVLEGEADMAFGLEVLAHQYGLAFTPVIVERFDILIDRRTWFEPPVQKLQAFCRSAKFRERAHAHPGYDCREFGRVRFNGP
ncbi:MAG: substrate-binding domain-containing protein, partial [Hyphomicrobiaceae bacterium]